MLRDNQSPTPHAPPTTDSRRLHRQVAHAYAPLPHPTDHSPAPAPLVPVTTGRRLGGYAFRRPPGHGGGLGTCEPNALLNSPRC